jgi:adenosylmethionine-8-amino-7-oxononanoate aminotransferase
MSGGYAPLSALLWSERVASAFWGDETHPTKDTFNANPLSAAVGYAVLSYIIDNNLLENARTVGTTRNSAKVNWSPAATSCLPRCRARACTRR